MFWGNTFFEYSELVEFYSVGSIPFFFWMCWYLLRIKVPSICTCSILGEKNLLVQCSVSWHTHQISRPTESVFCVRNSTWHETLTWTFVLDICTDLAFCEENVSGSFPMQMLHYSAKVAIKWLLTSPTLYEILVPRYDSGPTFKNTNVIFFFALPGKIMKF